MAFEILPRPDGTMRLAPVESQRAPVFCLGLLSAACALASLVFACATPFAAFAVIAAGMLPLRSALVAMAGAWLVNQALGFAVLGYPIAATTLCWAFVIGAAALAATLAAALVLRAVPRLHVAPALGLALAAAFAAYELALGAASLALGGAGDFTGIIVSRLGVMSLLWLIGLVTACDVASVLMAPRRPQMSS